MNRKTLAASISDQRLRNELTITANAIATQGQSLATQITQRVEHRAIYPHGERPIDLSTTATRFLRAAADLGTNVRWLRDLIKEEMRREDRVDAGFGTLPTKATAAEKVA